jgi:hypothetical protein
LSRAAPPQRPARGNRRRPSDARPAYAPRRPCRQPPRARRDLTVDTYQRAAQALVDGFHWADDEGRGSAPPDALQQQTRIVEALLAGFDGTLRRQLVDVTSREARSTGCSKAIGGIEMGSRLALTLVVAALIVGGYALATAGARPPDFCQKHSSHLSCQTTSSTTTTSTTTTTTTTPPPTTTTTPTTTTPPPPGVVPVPCGANISLYVPVAGGTLQLGSCTYPDQDFRSGVPLVVQGQLGTTLGEISTHGATAVTFKNLRARRSFLAPQNGSGGGANSANITFDTVDFYQGGIFTRGCINCAFVNGSSGNTCDGYSQTIGAYSSANPSAITVQNWTFHDMSRACAPGAHTECLFIQESSRVTLQSVAFNRCEVFDLYISDLFGGPIANVSVRDSHFDQTTPTGYYAVEINFPTTVEFLRDSFDQGLYVQQGGVSGCGNTRSGSFLFPASLLVPC